jgi:23S rRNA pseudouridine1911/1915/1917 synthase
MKVIYEDKNVRVFDKPAGVNADDIPQRVHRLDKDTSGILLTAKNNETLTFLQKQFKERKVEKKYLALVVGNLKNKKGEIKTLLGRSPKDRRKQKVYLPHEPEAQGKRETITKYKVLQRFTPSNSCEANLTELKNYDLIEVEPKTGRKHQIRAHLAFLGHPVAGDKLYGFKNQPCPKNLKRQFLHASYLRIKLPDGKIQEFKSKIPEDLNVCLKNLKH